MGQGGVDDPAALVVEDVRPDLAQRLWVGVAVEEVVLDLEVLAHRDEDLFGVLVGCFLGDAGHLHGQGDGKVEGVEGRLVDDDERVPVTGAMRETQCVSDGESSSEQRIKRRVRSPHFSSENLDRSTWSSGAVMRSMS